MQPHPENSYIEALLKNDRLEIEKIYEEFTPIVTSYVVTNSGSPEEAQDLFQDTLIDLYNMGRKGFVLNCPFKPYFLAMCRYKWLDQLKRNKKRFNKETEAFEVTKFKEHGLDNIQEEIENFLKEEKLFTLYREHLSKLSTTCQDVIGLGMVTNEETGKTNSLKDIAALLEMNYSYIRREKNNCLNKLIASIKSDPRYIKK